MDVKGLTPQVFTTLLALWHWASCFTSLGLSFLIHKMEIIIMLSCITVKIQWDCICKIWCLQHSSCSGNTPTIILQPERVTSNISRGNLVIGSNSISLKPASGPFLWFKKVLSVTIKVNLVYLQRRGARY